MTARHKIRQVSYELTNWETADQPPSNEVETDGFETCITDLYGDYCKCDEHFWLKELIRSFHWQASDVIPVDTSMRCFWPLSSNM